MENARKPKRFSLRGFTSLLLMGLLLVMGFSGAMLYASPRGRVANWTDWALLGLDKDQWEGLHLNAGVLFLAVAVLHLAINWRPFWGYIKKRAGLGLNRKAELALATAITAGLVVGVLYQVPPFQNVVDWRDGLKDYWEGRTARAPVPHAEEFTLAEFAGQIRLSPGEAIEALRKEGYEVAAPTITLAELAGSKAVPPSRILADIQKHFPEAGNFPVNAGAGQGGHGAGRGMGMGRGLGMGCGTGMGGGMGRGAGQGVGPGANLGSGCDAETEACSGADSATEPARPQHADQADCPGAGQAMGQGLGGGRGFGRALGQGRGQGRGLGQGGGMGRGFGGGMGPEAEPSEDSPQ